MLATYVQLPVTNGKSAMSWYIALLLAGTLIPGILSASNEGILLPALCWLVVVAASRHRFSMLGTIVLLSLALLIWEHVFPFSQNARGPVHSAETVSKRVDLIIEYFQNLEHFSDVLSDVDEGTEFGTAFSKVSILSRFSVLKSIDMLVAADEQLGYTPIERVAPGFLYVVPHVIWPQPAHEHHLQ